MSETTYRFDNESVSVLLTVDEKEFQETGLGDTVAEQPKVTKKIRVNQDYVKGGYGKPFLLDGVQVNSVEILGPCRVKASSEYDKAACRSVRHAWIETEAEVVSE